LALCTNKPRSVTLALLDALSARGRFSVIVAGGDLPDKKPSPGPILACARALSLPPSSLVVVGDGTQDILAGKRAGCRTVDGGYMNVGQAARGFKLFTGLDADEARMESHFRRLAA
jgi:beta-phosphoglucomutase-like phosphatase (HAD superfamily)